ncbi:MAG: hypothetical protein PHR14_08775 [Oscillospiraceae bacterium]|nr:hypothetical protein [Oscillospiraceae bacterium]
MAYTRFNNYRSKATGYARKAGGYARRGAYRAGGYARKAGGYVKKYQTKANQGFGPKGFKIYPDIPLGAGVLVGLTNIDRMIPPWLLLGIASLPIGGTWGRSIRNAAGGVILGEMISQKTGFKIPIPATTTTDSVTGFYA